MKALRISQLIVNENERDLKNEAKTIVSFLLSCDFPCCFRSVV